MIDTASLRRFIESIRRLPVVVAQRVATAAAPAITELAASTFDASATAYGVPWKPGAEGQKVTLRKTGSLASRLVYVAIGTKLRVSLGVPYAKFQIGRRSVFPIGALPPAYAATLSETAARVVREELSR